MVARSHARADVSAITPGVISGLDRTGRFAAYALAAVTVAGVLVQAFIFENLVDRFLMIKDMALRTQAIVSLFLLSAALLYGGWSRFRSLLEDRLVATLLVAIPVWTAIGTIATIVLAMSVRRVSGYHRWSCAIGALFGLFGVVMSATRTALIAVIAIFVLAAAMRSWKRAIVVAVLFMFLFAAGVKFHAPGMD